MIENNKKADNCWECLNCSDDIKSSCLAFKTKSGKECWMIVGSFTTIEARCPGLVHKYKYCWECPWFKEMNPDFNKKIS